MSRWTFFSLYVGLHVPGWLNVLGRLPVVTCDFEPPEHAPRTSAGAHTCAVVFGWAPGVWSREHEKRPAARREKNIAKNVHLVHTVVITGSPSGWLRLEIPGVTQVDEKGHEGNTAVVTAHLFCWRKHGKRDSRTGIPAVY